MAYRGLASVCILTVMMFSEGCTQLALTGSQSNNGVSEFTKEEKIIYPQRGSDTVYRCFYSDKLWSTWDREKSIKGVGLYEVRYHTNMLFALTTVLSLGIVVPQGVEWELQDIHPANNSGSEWGGDGKSATTKSKRSR